jgi:hypothetical protein
MINEHVSDPYYYKNQVPIDELSIIILQSYDLDDKYIYTNTHAILRITLLPNHNYGEFYTISGSIISIDDYNSTLITFDPVLNIHGIKYRPPLNEISTTPSSVYTSFNYDAIDSITGKVYYHKYSNKYIFLISSKIHFLL